MSQLRDLGYQQITALGTAAAPTIPAGTTLILATASGQPVRWRADGTAPTATVGYPLAVGVELKYTGARLLDLKFIQTAATATLDLQFFGE